MSPFSGFRLSWKSASTFFTSRLSSSNSMLMVFMYLFRRRQETLVSKREVLESTIVQSSTGESMMRAGCQGNGEVGTQPCCNTIPKPRAITTVTSNLSGVVTQSIPNIYGKGSLYWALDKSRKLATENGFSGNSI